MNGMIRREDGGRIVRRLRRFSQMMERRNDSIHGGAGGTCHRRPACAVRRNDSIRGDAEGFRALPVFGTLPANGIAGNSVTRRTSERLARSLGCHPEPAKDLTTRQPVPYCRSAVSKLIARASCAPRTYMENRTSIRPREILRKLRMTANNALFFHAPSNRT